MVDADSETDDLDTDEPQSTLGLILTLEILMWTVLGCGIIGAMVVVMMN